MLMPRETRRPATAIAAAVALAGLLLAAGGAVADIDVGDINLAEIKTAEIMMTPTKVAEIDAEDRRSPHPPVAKRVRPPVQVQCWQEGVKIIDETGLTEITLSSFLSQVTRPSVVDGDAVGLKGRDEQGGNDESGDQDADRQ